MDAKSIANNYLQKYKTPLLIGGGVLGVLAGIFLWNHFHKHVVGNPPAPVYETYEQSHSAGGVQAAAKQSGVSLTLPQEKEIIEAIQESDGKKPDSVVATTGAQLAAAVKTEQIKSGADFTIVSPSKPGESGIKQASNTSSTTLPKLQDNQPVTLNQYNIKAYPDRLLEASVYGDGSGDVAYLSKVKVLGMTGYVGPTVKYDPNKTTSKVTVGARITVPF